MLEDLAEQLDEVCDVCNEIKALIDEDFGGDVEQFMAVLTSSADYATLKVALSRFFNDTLF